MNRAAVNIIAALSAGLLLAYVGPRLDEEQAVHADRIAAEKTAQQRARFERAAQAMCGENAGWRELDNGAVQCMTKKGRKTMVAEVVL